MPRERSPFNLYKRNGQYFARFWSDIEQKYVATRATGETNRDRAVRIASDMLERGDVVPRSRDPFLLDYLAEYWKQPERECGERYRAEAERHIKNVVAEWPEGQKLRLSKVDRAALYRLRDWLVKQKSGRMVNRIMQSVKVPLAVAYDKAQIAQNPGLGVKKVDEKSQRRGALTVEEVQALIAWNGEKRLHAALLLAALAGLRRGEIRALRWQYVDFDSGLIHVEENYVEIDGMKEPKAGSRRTIMLHPALDGVLRELAKVSPYTEPDDFVIPQIERGVPVADVTIRRGLHKALADIGIDEQTRKARKISLHALRHTFVSHMRQVLPDFLVQAQAGHSSERMTRDVYSDRRVVDFQAYRKAYGKLYAPKKGKKAK